MENTQNLYTEKVIYWIRYHEYSRNHWRVVAQEILDEVKGDLAEATIKLSFAIRSFHLKFQDAVVKPGNVLYDMVDMGFILVDWDAVAADCYSDLGI